MHRQATSSTYRSLDNHPRPTEENLQPLLLLQPWSLAEPSSIERVAAAVETPPTRSQVNRDRPAPAPTYRHPPAAGNSTVMKCRGHFRRADRMSDGRRSAQSAAAALGTSGDALVVGTRCEVDAVCSSKQPGYLPYSVRNGGFWQLRHFRINSTGHAGKKEPVVLSGDPKCQSTTFT